MNRLTRTAALAGLGMGVFVVRRFLRQTPAARTLREPKDRWLVVTVNRSQEEIAPDGVWPQPLADLGDDVEIELRPAPADRGTEIAVRQRNPGADAGMLNRVVGNSRTQEIRSALRKTKQLLEAGEVLKVDPQPHGQRKPTPGGALIAVATKRAGREGVL